MHTAQMEGKPGACTDQKEISAWPSRSAAPAVVHVIYSAFGEKIKNCLKTPETFSKEFRHYVKKKKFRLAIYIIAPYIARAERSFGNTN